MNRDDVWMDKRAETNRQRIREDLHEEPAEVKWMGLTLWVQYDDGPMADARSDFDDEPLTITWAPRPEDAMAESLAFAEIYHPQLGRQIHDKETVEGCQSCAIAGIDPTAEGAFGNLISTKDFIQIAALGWASK